MTDFAGQMARDYGSGAQAWAAGPALVYQRLADALIAESPESLTGKLILDLGTGTGVASRALSGVGARSVGVDRAEGMLRYADSQRSPGAGCDAMHTPFRDNAFDGVVAAFILNHLADAAAGLGECHRVTRPGGLLLASSFPDDTEHPAKTTIEQVVKQFGYRRPDWYEYVRQSAAHQMGSVETCSEATRLAGYRNVVTHLRSVEVGLDDPVLAVEWRLNMPHTLQFVQGLDTETQRTLRAEALNALPSSLPSAIDVLMVTGVSS